MTTRQILQGFIKNHLQLLLQQYAAICFDRSKEDMVADTKALISNILPLVNASDLDVVNSFMKELPNVIAVYRQKLISMPQECEMVSLYAFLGAGICKKVLVPKDVAELMPTIASIFDPELYPKDVAVGQTSKQRPFTEAEDELLAFGIKKFGSDYKSIVKYMLPSKSVEKVRNRIKNLKRAAAPHNPIEKCKKPRQKIRLVQGSQFHTGNTPGQSLEGMQLGMSMMDNAYNLNSQIRANGPLTFKLQGMNQGQIRPQLSQQLSQQNALASGQIILNATLDPEAAEHLLMSYNEFVDPVPSFEATLAKHPRSSVVELKDVLLHPEKNYNLTIPGFSSEERKDEQNNNPMSLNQQQLSQMEQHQQQQNRQQQIGHQQQHLLQQLSPGSAGQNSVSLTGFLPDATELGATTPGGSSSQGTDVSNHLLGKRKIQDLAAQVDLNATLNPEVERFSKLDDEFNSPFLFEYRECDPFLYEYGELELEPLWQF